MSIFLFNNNAASTLAGPITATATTIQLAAGGGAQFTPPPGGGQLFCMTLNDVATELLREIIHVTNVTGDILTVVRAQEGTTALSWLAGDLIINQWTAGSAAQMLQQGQLPGTLIFVAGADTGTANNIVVATTPVITSLTAGNIIEVTKGTLSNTGAMTIQQNGSAATPITWANGSPLAAGDWPASAAGLISYQAGGTFQLISFTSSANQNLVHYAVAGGTANALTAAFSPAIGSLPDGLLFELTPSATNTTAATINPNGLGAVAIQNVDGSALIAQTLTSGVPTLLMSLGGAMRVLTPISGLINVQTFTSSGTYTPTAGTQRIIVEVLGGGGGGGGAGPTPTVGYTSVGGGGGAGSYAKSLLTSGFTGGIVVTVGSGGNYATYNPGHNGGTSSFGSLLSAAGGFGGGYVAPTSGLTGIASSQGVLPTLGNLLNAAGTTGGISFATGNYTGWGGWGAPGPWGGGAQPPSQNANGLNGNGPGAGGSGTCSANVGYSLTGGAGAPGIVIVYEF